MLTMQLTPHKDKYKWYYLPCHYSQLIRRANSATDSLDIFAHNAIQKHREELHEQIGGLGGAVEQ